MNLNGDKPNNVVIDSNKVNKGSNDPFFMSENNTYDGLCETYAKLNQTTKLLKKLKLYNTKYLYNRNDIYYFVLKVDNQTIFKSLKTSHLTYAYNQIMIISFLMIMCCLMGKNLILNIERIE